MIGVGCTFNNAFYNAFKILTKNHGINIINNNHDFDR